MHISKVLMALAAASLFVTGCSQQRSSATKALDGIEHSLAEVKGDAAKYAPDGLKAVEGQVASLHESLEKKEYEQVLAGAPQLEKAVGSLKHAVAAGKENAKAALAAAHGEWKDLNVEVPRMVGDIETRVDELSKKKMHFKVSKEEIESAKSDLEWMKNQWAEAVSASTSGKQIKATNMAKAVKAKGEEVRKTLGMKEA